MNNSSNQTASAVPLDVEGITLKCYYASPGPWSALGEHVSSASEYIAMCSDTNGNVTAQAVKDAEFIAAARTVVPKCLDRIGELERERTRHRIALMSLQQWLAKSAVDVKYGFDPHALSDRLDSFANVCTAALNTPEHTT